jgi:chromosomal replication initiation ATPase DnaA
MRSYAILFTGRWAEQMATGERDLEEALRPIVEHARREGKKLEVRRLRRASATRAPRETREQLRERVMAVARPYRAAVALRHGIPIGRLAVIRRQGPELKPIQELAWLLRTLTALSFLEISVAMERNDHTTAIDAYERAEAVMAERPGLREELLGLVAGGRGDARIAAVGQ